jgi:hypothetical protein
VSMVQILEHTSLKLKTSVSAPLGDGAGETGSAHHLFSKMLMASPGPELHLLSKGKVGLAQVT